MFGGLFQPTHLILILVVVLIVFGPGKLPEAAKAMGKAMRDMRTSFAGDDETETKTTTANGSEVAAVTNVHTSNVGNVNEDNKNLVN